MLIKWAAEIQLKPMPKAQFLETTDREMPSHKTYLFTNYFSKPAERERGGGGRKRAQKDGD